MTYPESYWNHRLYEYADGTLVIVECFYESGKPQMRNDGANVVGDDLSEVMECLQHMHDALNRPILTKADFNGEE